MPLHRRIVEFIEGIGGEISPGVPRLEGIIPEILTTAGSLSGGIEVDWLQSAFQLLGDIFDPIFPGGQASETRVAARGGAGSRRRLSAAGVVVEANGQPRRRRRRALTASDRADLAFITATLGAPAAKTALALMITRTGA